MSVARHHADWLNLVESSGPFVSLPVLMRVFPQGLDPRDPEQARDLRLAYEEWQTNPSGPGKQRAWISHVLTRVLKFPAELIAEGQSLPPGLAAPMLEYGETLRPDLALVGPKGSDVVDRAQLLLGIYRADQELDRPVADKHWKATAATRMMELLHATDVPLGLVTNGEQWMLVFAPRGETTGFASWYATLWIEEQITLRAFHSLLSISRFFGVAGPDTLLALLRESAQDQQEVTNQLGDQVRDAVQVLIQAFDRLDHETGRSLLKNVQEKTLYDAALTVMMRLVFLFSAEERGLLHLGKPIYDNNYAVSTLREQLQETADRYGEEVLERRVDAWSRLLSSFRAIHDGIQHQDLTLPTYGGSLFDPDRYPFLEGRAQGSDWRLIPAEPLAISNRVVLHLLKSLQMLQVRVPGGGVAEARRISFRALDIEQIGHIYEGLLDHTASRASETVLGLVGTRKNSAPNITLDRLESLAKQGETKFLEELEEFTGRGTPALKKALSTETGDDHKIIAVCGQDEGLRKRISPFVGLLRADSFDRPVVVLQDGIYVSEGTTRRSSGTHYTPRTLTEPIVQHALEPLVYIGPTEGLPKEQWQLRSPQEILDLNVCDMTMGSGAFLVQTCRYLSERLAEAWENLEKMHPVEFLITPEGLFSKGEPNERLVPKDLTERLAVARRLIADRCIYGVDINPMATEMAKLSIWLTTVDRNRPFTFLDHALKCGDSVLGIFRLEQLEKFSLQDKRETQAIILSNYDELVRAAISKRSELERLPSNDASQIAAKEILNSEADDLLTRLRLAADLLTATALVGSNEQDAEVARISAHLKTVELMTRPVEEFRKFAQDQLGQRRAFHWPLEFPEVVQGGGFHCFLGNPPYLGGARISGTLGEDYLAFLLSTNPHAIGNADLSSYFLRRACALLADGGTAGLVTTNSVAKGETRESGLQYLLQSGVSIPRATKSSKWPGTANVFVSILHLFKGTWVGELFLNEQPVRSISSFLDSHAGDFETKRLLQNLNLVFRGPTVGGEGFILTRTEADELVKRSPNCRDVIRRFLTGHDINQDPRQESERFVIDFANRTESEAMQYGPCWERLFNTVRLQRLGNKIKQREKYWWRFIGRQEKLYEAIVGMERVLACGEVSKYWGATWVAADQVFAGKVVIFALSSDADFAFLNSCFHTEWAEKTASRLKDDPSYSLAETFETLPFPAAFLAVRSGSELPDLDRQHLDRCNAVGAKCHQHRTRIMTERQEGLTDIYNRFHDPAERSTDIDLLRALHLEMDQLVAGLYRWSDLDLHREFYDTKKGARYSIGEEQRHTVLDRLLGLNFKQNEEEIVNGFLPTSLSIKSEKRRSRKVTTPSSRQNPLFTVSESE